MLTQGVLYYSAPDLLPPCGAQSVQRTEGNIALTWPLKLHTHRHSDLKPPAQEGYSHKIKTKLNSVAFTPQANYTDRPSDRRLLAKLVPTFADRGCRVVSATDPPGH
jgi:hypothetical protein